MTDELFPVWAYTANMNVRGGHWALVNVLVSASTRFRAAELVNQALVVHNIDTFPALPADIVTTDLWATDEMVHMLTATK